MILGTSKPVELPAILKPHRNALLARQLHDLFRTGILPAFGDDNAVQRSRSFQRFPHRVNSREAIHGKPVYKNPGKSMTASFKVFSGPGFFARP
jgi:hypothetical protein